MVNGGLRAVCKSAGRFSWEEAMKNRSPREQGVRNEHLALAARLYREAIRSNSSSTIARRAGGSGLSDAAKPTNAQ
jgi:hypothetical protein